MRMREKACQEAMRKPRIPTLGRRLIPPPLVRKAARPPINNTPDLKADRKNIAPNATDFYTLTECPGDSKSLLEHSVVFFASSEKPVWQ